MGQGKIHYFIAGGQGGRPGGQGGSSSSSDASQITSWVEAHFTATTLGRTTVYDLSAGSSS